MKLTSTLWILPALATASLAAHAEPARRAAPPQWGHDDVAPFFADAREHLSGERPVPAKVASAPTNAVEPADKFAWSHRVGPDALATEVKRLAARLAAPLSSPSSFKSGGYNLCRADFAMLAVVFAVIEQYDGDVRWRHDAAAMRVACARASANCKSASDQSFADAARRRQELDELIRGAQLNGADAEPVEQWSDLVDRKLLMQRMQRGLEDTIKPQLADQRTFTRSAADVRHEAEILGLLAAVICREEFEFWDDETFVESARELGAAATELSRAAADDDYEAARSAAGRAGQGCATCHEGYRG